MQRGAGIRPAPLSAVSIVTRYSDGRFSNRPVGVKRFQTIHLHGIGVARGLVLLSGIGT
jgi:hypothetical protein